MAPLSHVCTSPYHCPPPPRAPPRRPQIEQRLLDKKLSVRKEAAAHLLRVYHCYCRQYVAGSAYASHEAAAMGIPGRMLAAARAMGNAELWHWLLDGVLAGGLLPPGLDEEQALDCWVRLLLPQPLKCLLHCRARQLMAICLAVCVVALNCCSRSMAAARSAVLHRRAAHFRVNFIQFAY